MILDDLFEQKPLPAHIKASDLPPGMRSRLTMRDIEAERPKSAYRYRVTPGVAGESPKDFMDLAGAQEYAQAVRGRVQPLEEKLTHSDASPDTEGQDQKKRLDLEQATGGTDQEESSTTNGDIQSRLSEKKRPQPTNPDLWSRAKSAARSKFDVYPSAYANAWAAKWYKSKGGGWRMGKPKKK